MDFVHKQIGFFDVWNRRHDVEGRFIGRVDHVRALRAEKGKDLVSVRCSLRIRIHQEALVSGKEGRETMAVS